MSEETCVCGKITYATKGRAHRAAEGLRKRNRETKPCRVYRCEAVHPSVVVYHLGSSYRRAEAAYS
jgi:hypothetical protein